MFDIEAALRAKGITNIALLPNRVVLTIPYPPPLRGQRLAYGSTLEAALLDFESRISTVSNPQEDLSKEKDGCADIQEAYTANEIDLWISAQLAKLHEGYDNCDNFRSALVEDRDQMDKYIGQQDNSCCGYFDEVHIGPDGKKYMLGFNYGH